jgi:hypothetical protein
VTGVQTCALPIWKEKEREGKRRKEKEREGKRRKEKEREGKRREDWVIYVEITNTNSEIEI